MDEKYDISFCVMQKTDYCLRHGIAEGLLFPAFESLSILFVKYVSSLIKYKLL